MAMIGAAAAIAIAAMTPTAACPSSIDAGRRDLAAAMAKRDVPAIDAAIATLTCHQASLPPERAERFAPLTAPVTLDVGQRAAAWSALWQEVDRRSWWTQSAKPEALRVPAEVIRASLAHLHAGGDRTASLRRARAAADYLLRAQAEGGTGVFGFPLDPAPGTEAETLIARFRREADRQGLIATLTRGGWVIDDRGNGDLNYDNGLAGQALLALWRETRDPRDLAGARRAGEWAMTRPIVPNFNYNGFSAALLADLYRATGERRFLDDAVARITLGVLPGQIASGPRAGHWIDPHNKRLVYRYIMIGQMAEVVEALPADTPARARIMPGLMRALAAAEAQQTAAGGVGNLNAAVVTYCRLARLPADLRGELGVPSALQRQLWAITGETLRRQQPVAGAAAIGCYLADTGH